MHYTIVFAPHNNPNYMFTYRTWWLFTAKLYARVLRKCGFKVTVLLKVNY